MKICLVAHQFIPDNNAGVEIYVHRLGRALLAGGHDVLVYTTRKDLTRKDGEILDEVWDGVPVRRVVRNLFHESFTSTYRDELAERVFTEAVLEAFRPDLVHVHHLIHHSMGLPSRAKSAGVPVVMTLHDYWLECPRMGRLLRWDDGVCENVELDRCAQCMQRFDWRNPPKLKLVASGLRGLRRTTGLDLQRPLQKVFRSARPKSKPDAPMPRPDRGLRDELEVRQHEVRAVLEPAVDRFLCPSRFLRDRIRDFGVDPERLFHHPYGVPRPPSSWRRQASEGPVRIAFCGSVLPHKGPHVVLEAFARVREKHGPDEVALAIHGGSGSNPIYGERIAARGEELGAEVTGGYGPDDVDTLLAKTDLLVVPSVWFENQPITILDARVRGIPVIVSDFGGMAELVADPALRFQVGDAEDLARAIEAFLDGREPCDEYFPPTPEEDLQNTLKHYSALVR